MPVRRGHKQTNPHTHANHTVSQALISSLFCQCRSVCEHPKHREVRGEGEGQKNNPEWINQMFWFVTDALLSLCLLAIWVLCRCANQPCLPPPPPFPFHPLLLLLILSMNVCICFLALQCVCVGKALRGGCMYECTRKYIECAAVWVSWFGRSDVYVCVCSVGVSTPTPGAINSCKLWMTPKLLASQPDLVWRLSV